MGKTLPRRDGGRVTNRSEVNVRELIGDALPAERNHVLRIYRPGFGLGRSGVSLLREEAKR